MKLAVIGLGSMGKRRVRDLLRLGCSLVGFDTRPDRRIESENLFSITTVDSFDKIILHKPDAIIISTPPDTHYQYYELCYDHRIPFFSEANIFTPKASWFEEQACKTGVQSYPSTTWHFHPLFRLLKEKLASPSVKVNSTHYHYAGFLPFWHPWEDYADFYAGQKKTSAAREMVPFEMEALCWIFGQVKAVSANFGRSRKWKTDMDDFYHLLLEFESGLSSTCLIELHQSAPFRRATISCENGAFFFDGSEHVVKEYKQSSDSWSYHRPASQRTLGSFDFEEIYFEEIQHFMDSLKGDTAYIKSWAEDRHLSDILFAAEISCGQRRWISIDEISDSYNGDTY